MADNAEDAEKTEEATLKKQDEAYEKGDVIRSQEVTTWFMLFAGTLIIAMSGGSMGERLNASLAVYFSNAHAISIDGPQMFALLVRLGSLFGMVVLTPLLLLPVAAIVSNLIQHRLVFTIAPLGMKLNKISPLAGFKRLFSATSLINFVKGVIKLCIIGSLIVAVVWPRRDELAMLIDMEPLLLLTIVWELTLRVMSAVLAVMGVLAALDYLYQRFEWNKKQRMTLKEIRDEHKQMEGDPALRARLRQIRQERGRRRITDAVPKASVVIVNPTHYAVALLYETGMNAPVCLAKGMDALALKIRDIAGENEIPVVENPPLARALHSTAQIDKEIPPEHYKAVAQVIRYVMSLREGNGGKSRR